MKIDTNNKYSKNQSVTLEYILSKVSELQIYQAYVKDIKPGYIYNSPFRKDRNPSFGIFYSNKTKRLLFKDHGTNECGDIIKFVSLMTNLTNYNDILNQIVTDLSVNDIKKPNISIEPQVETIIGIVRQPFSDKDFAYWGQFGITKKTLTKFNVFCTKYYLSNGIVKGIYKEENPIYAYKVYDKFKIYRPLGDKYTKWRSNLTTEYVQGYEQLPKTGDLLIITKSLKDVMTLYEMGYTAIAVNSESNFIPDAALEDVLKRFKRVLLLFDRDITGVRQMRKLSLKTGLKGFLINKRFNAKDISDAVQLHGKEKIKEWLDKELK